MMVTEPCVGPGAQAVTNVLLATTARTSQISIRISPPPPLSSAAASFPPPTGSGSGARRIAWPPIPDHHHGGHRRPNRHEDATEDQHPAQRNTREDGQDSSEGRLGDEKPDQGPHKLPACALQKMHSPHGHRLLHQSECLAPYHATNVSYLPRNK